MKLLCLLFATFVLFMAARPCCADKDCKDELKLSLQKANEQSDQNECTDCSPFFSCGACTGFTIGRLVSHEGTLFEEQIQVAYLIHPIPSVIKMPLAIWQPPRLG